MTIQELLEKYRPLIQKLSDLDSHDFLESLTEIEKIEYRSFISELIPALKTNDIFKLVPEERLFELLRDSHNFRLIVTAIDYSEQAKHVSELQVADMIIYQRQGALGNSLFKRDLALKIQSAIDDTAKLFGEYRKDQVMKQAILAKIGTYINCLELILEAEKIDTIDDLITHSLIRIISISNKISIPGLCSNEIEYGKVVTTGITLFKNLEHICTHLQATSPSAFKTIFGDSYYGLGITSIQELFMIIRSTARNIGQFVGKIISDESSADDINSDLVTLKSLVIGTGHKHHVLLAAAAKADDPKQPPSTPKPCKPLPHNPASPSSGCASTATCTPPLPTATGTTPTPVVSPYSVGAVVSFRNPKTDTAGAEPDAAGAEPDAARELFPTTPRKPARLDLK